MDVAEITEASPATVLEAWEAYDREEMELWREYAEDPNYVAGRVYLAGERLYRRRCEVAVRRCRYADPELRRSRRRLERTLP